MEATSAVPGASLRLVAPIARAVQAQFRSLLTLADLIQIGALGLIAATVDLDPARDQASQCAYLRQRIRGAMLDSLRRELKHKGISVDVPARAPGRTMGELLLRLPPRSRAILELRMQGYTQAETGVAMRISQSRVSRIESAAIRTLQRAA